MTKPLPQILHEKLLPWAQSREMLRLVVAQPSLKGILLPSGVCASRMKLRSKRTPIKGPRGHSNLSTVTAHWPQDGLIEKKVAQLACVVNGEADLALGEYTLHCGAGHFILIPPGVPHPVGQNHPHLSEAAQRHEGHCDLVWFGKWGRAIRCYLCHSRGHTHRHNVEENYFILNPRAVQLFELLTSEATERNDGYERACQYLLSVFLLIVARELSQGRYLHPGSLIDEDQPAGDEDDPIEQIQRHVKLHLSEPLTIEQAAHQVYMSRALFTQRFRRQTGQSFNEFVTQCRLQEAKTLLAESEWAIALIIKFVGIKSPAHFSRLFQRHVGTSPTEFRRRARRQQAAPKRGDAE